MLFLKLYRCGNHSVGYLQNVSTLIYQNQKRGCGYASIKMMLCHYSKKKEFRYLEEPPCYDEAPSLSDLIRYAERHGLYLKAYRYKEVSRLGENKFYPLLALLEEDGLSHLVYVERKAFGHFYILDPARGRRKLKEESFYKIFTGVFIIEEEYRAKEERIASPRYLDPLRTFISCLLSSASFLSLFASFYFVDDSGGLLLPILLFCSFCLFVVLERGFLSWSMKKFDRSYISSLSTMPYGTRREAYIHYVTFKAGIFSRAPSLVSGALEIAALGVLFWLNEEWMGRAILSLFVLLLLTEALWGPWFRKKSKEVEESEDAFLGGYTYEKDDRRLISDLLRGSYRLAGFQAMRGYAFFLIELLLAFAVTYLSGSISLNAFFLWFMSLWFLGDEFQKCMKTLLSKDELLKEEAYFLSHFSCSA